MRATIAIGLGCVMAACGSSSPSGGEAHVGSPVAPAPVQPQPQPVPAPTCAELPPDYAYRPSAGAYASEDRLVLVPPYTVRAERTIAGATTRCEITLSACGADNTWTADDVIAAITHPEVTAGLAEMAAFGDRTGGGPVFVLEHGTDRLTVGRPCAAGA